MAKNTAKKNVAAQVNKLVGNTPATTEDRVIAMGDALKAVAAVIVDLNRVGLEKPAAALLRFNHQLARLQDRESKREGREAARKAKAEKRVAALKKQIDALKAAGIDISGLLAE